MKSLSTFVLISFAFPLTACGSSVSLPDACESAWNKNNPTAKEVTFSRVRASPTIDEVASLYSDFHMSMLEQSGIGAKKSNRILSDEYGQDAAERQVERGNELYLANTKLTYFDGRTRFAQILCIETDSACACLADSTW